MSVGTGFLVIKYVPTQLAAMSVAVMKDIC